jgi:aspartate kinase
MKNITVYVKNVSGPSCRERPLSHPGCRAQGIKSISFMKNMSIIKIYGAGAGTKTGVISEISSKLTDAGVNLRCRPRPAWPSNRQNDLHGPAHLGDVRA